MSVLLITYDLRKPGQDYKGFYQVIKNYAWARLSESSYAIETDKSPETIYNELRHHMDDNDNLMVITLTSPWYGYNGKDVIDWLQKRLPIYQAAYRSW